LQIKNWIACVQYRRIWKEVVEKAKTFKYEVQHLEEEEAEQQLGHLMIKYKIWRLLSNK
jgi:hypothetical protein